MIPFNVQDFMAGGAFVCGTRQLAGKTNLSKQLVQKLLDAGITVHILDASQAWNGFLNNVVHFTPTADNTGFNEVSIDVTKSTIYDMSAVGHKQRISIANQVCRAILKMHVIDGYVNPTVIVFEECQTYLYNGCMRSSENFESIIDYITIGGNYHTSFLAITQFPAMVDKAIVKAAQQRYFGLTSEKNDVGYVKSFIDNSGSDKIKTDLGIDKKDKRFITHFLKRGQFVYQHLGNVQLMQCQKYEKPTPQPYFTVQVNYGT
jgi:hypothetical protein